ncbi:hypothetical protein BDV41DRAFT_578450 [Aspergillus transmontanensis]|uniref:DUF6606 domain-containing protein n=1 Tax=Aspergillus transmontanensis TaxID=1034304 RepID=A0A5N6VTP2_9EURO|nr:hypothetical protein BDV41DRAFT_578450 [Aspergillus transmontanensis]
MAVHRNILPLTFSHIVLPPKLPGKRETEAQVLEVQNDLLSRVIDAVGQLKEISDAKAVVAWESIEKTLRTLGEVSTEGWVNEASLLGALEELQPGNAIILHVALQNACILIRYPPDEDENIIFETFETSATAESTLAAKGALEWDFPGSAVPLPLEIEQEREIQRPLIMDAHYYSGLHDSIRNFVITGRLKGNEGYMEAAAVLELTGLGRKHGIDASMLLRSLYVSTEFTRTVVTNKQARSIDNFLRPVNWLLLNSQRKVGLVIIPEEAEEVIPIIRTMQSSAVHLIIYAAPFTKRMLQFDCLDYYSLPSLPKGWSPPSWLPFELGILAGRLYFHFSDYEFLLEQLRLDSEKAITNVNPAGARTPAACDDSFVRSQLNFLQDWLTLRRQGQDISHTLMGYVCQGSRLRPDHPFFLARKAVEEIEDTDRRLFYTTNYRNSDELEEYYDSDDDDDDDVVAEDVDMIEGEEDDVSDVDVDMHEED